ncbi:type II secretion system F family protein [Patescibacteria group bacterium]|nr:type II secretion system F family protein [Patescibacteria group bacterium]
MPLYEYRAKNLKGNLISGTVEAADETNALEILADRHFTPFYLQEKSSHHWLDIGFKFFNKIKTKDLVIFSRQLAVMAAATVPLVESLHILVKQTENEALRIVVSDVADEVEGGSKLSAALGKYPNTFSDFYINMVKSGETSGRLDDTLNYLADEAEKNYDLMSKIKGAMTYPAFIIVGLVIVGFVMMVFVVPKLTSILQESQTALPFSTRLLIGSSSFLQNRWWLLLIIIAILVVIFRFLTQTGSGRMIWHRFQLRLPVVGQLFKKIYLVRFTRSLGTLLQGGVPLTRSLNVVADVVGNEVFKDMIKATIKEVEEGNSVSTIFLQSNVVPAMVSQMMVVGEKTGRLEEILGRLSDFYGREVENQVTNLVTLVEPLIMIILGLAVGVMVSAIILPLYNLAGSF